jgi:glycosyltransferase involved in cell wall biosynthesis
VHKANEFERLRVLQVVLSLAPGGTERLVLELVKRSAPEIAMAVCCLDRAGAWGEDLRRCGIVVNALDRRAGFHPMLGYGVAQAARRHEAAVVHCHQYSPFVYSCLARLYQPSLRVIFTEHGRLSDAPPSPKRRLANTVLAQCPHEVFAVSEDLKCHIVSEGFSENRVGVIYNGIEIGPMPTSADRDGARVMLGLSKELFVIGTIARLDPVKDLEMLIRSVSRLNEARPTRLLVIGDGAERERLERTSMEMDHGVSTYFLGHRDDARSLLMACDVYANSSISEGVSLTILEAMAAGLPVVATRVGGTPEVVDESCARLVAARNPEAMTAALVELAGSPEKRAAMGLAGRARVEARFTLKRMVAEYREAYFRAAGVSPHVRH